MTTLKTYTIYADDVNFNYDGENECKALSKTGYCPKGYCALTM